MYPTLYRTARLAYRGGLRTRKHLRELERSQWLSREELQDWQLRKLRYLVQYAYEHVPYYYELFRGLDIHPQDIKSPKDFQKLPFLTKEDVNNNLETMVSPEFRGKLLPNQTGGSTGQPMRFFVDKPFLWQEHAMELRARGWYGVREGDKIAWVWGARRDMSDSGWKARLRAQIKQNRYLNAFSMTEGKMREFAETLVRWKPVMFRAYPAALSLFAQYIKDHQIGSIQPKLIETTAEKVTDPQRQLLEEVFQCKVADWYSSRELATIAFQCESGGHHVCETRYLEIVANDEVAQPGQLGEVVITSLNQFAMPFIRYKIGDMATFESASCSCGRGLPVLHEVVGRTGDFLVTADGQFVHGTFFANIFRVKPEVIRYQVYQPDKKHIEVRLVCKQKVDSTWLNNVHSEVKAHFGESMQITLRVVDNIELTSAGKHRFIISEVRPDFV